MLNREKSRFFPGKLPFSECKCLHKLHPISTLRLLQLIFTNSENCKMRQCIGSIFLLGLLFFCLSIKGKSQSLHSDSTTYLIQSIPSKYFLDIENKVSKYSGRINRKTQKTLKKLSKWELRIKHLLEKADPATAQQLFKNGLSFVALQQKWKQVDTDLQKSIQGVNSYQDRLNSQLKLIHQYQTVLDTGLRKQALQAKVRFDSSLSLTEKQKVLQALIKERKEALIQALKKQLIKTPMVRKLNKEVFYYVETVENYKELFSSPSSREKYVKQLLESNSQIRKLLRENSFIASLFPGTSNPGAVNLNGLQTRTAIEDQILTKFVSGNATGMGYLKEQMQAAQSEIGKLKSSLQQRNRTYGNGEEMATFKPNHQKSRTFRQRMVYGVNLQFTKASAWIPSGIQTAMMAGYRLNDKSILGFGVSYEAAFGSLQKVRIEHRSVGLRSYVDWKIKKQFFVSGGYEINRLFEMTSSAYSSSSRWQSVGLFGITKKMKAHSTFLKNLSIQFYYDILHRSHSPVTQPFVYRIGYGM